MTRIAAEVADEPIHLNYQAFMTCEAGNGWLHQADAQLASWLREKQLDVDLSSDSTTVDGTLRFTVARPETSTSHLTNTQTN